MSEQQKDLVASPSQTVGPFFHFGLTTEDTFGALAGRDVVTAMARAYEETEGSLADRLMAALVAGDCAGKTGGKS